MEREFLPQVIVETRPYQRAISEIWDEQTQIDFKNHIGLHPTQGDVIPGTGGVRKIRWQGAGHGKRGGVRVIYYFYDESDLSFVCVPEKYQNRLVRSGEKSVQGNHRES